jgi:hypothetical protein
MLSAELQREQFIIIFYCSKREKLARWHLCRARGGGWCSRIENGSHDHFSLLGDAKRDSKGFAIRLAGKENAIFLLIFALLTPLAPARSSSPLWKDDKLLFSG